MKRLPLPHQRQSSMLTASNRVLKKTCLSSGPHTFSDSLPPGDEHAGHFPHRSLSIRKELKTLLAQHHIKAAIWERHRDRTTEAPVDSRFLSSDIHIACSGRRRLSRTLHRLRR